MAELYSLTVSLSVNDGPSAMGRVAITGVAQRFMTDFPEMKVIMDRIEIRGPGSLRCVDYQRQLGVDEPSRV